MVGIPKVQLSKYSRLQQIVKGGVNQGQGILIFNGNVIKAVVYAGPKSPKKNPDPKGEESDEAHSKESLMYVTLASSSGCEILYILDLG